MAEPIGTASGVLTLSAFALNSSVSLYRCVNSFQNKRREIRELEDELDALRSVLESLEQLPSIKDVRFESLRLPLLHCGQACKGFEKVITDCSEHSSESKTSFREWAKLQYAGSDITGFRNMLAGYKATISIAIGDANLRTAAVSANVVQEFKILLENTTIDLRYHLEYLNSKLEELSVQKSSTEDGDIAKQKQIQKQIDGANGCITICAQASEHVGKVRVNTFEDVFVGEDANQVIVATFGDLISANRITAGAKATQILGQMADATVLGLVEGWGSHPARDS